MTSSQRRGAVLVPPVPHYTHITMKRLVIFACVLILGCLVSGYVGHRMGRQRVTTFEAGSFISTFDSLEKLRAGDIAAATRTLESQCFASAAGVLSEAGWRSDAVRKIMTPSLTRYRQTYRTNRAEWTPTEERLESLLTQRR